MKQTIEIEVPEGKKAIWEDGQIRFVSAESWKDITTFGKALEYLKQNHLRNDLINDYYNCSSESYIGSVIKYQIVVAALTGNEKRHLTTGDKWCPIVQFCRPEDKKNCLAGEVIGTIESEGERYLVVGGNANISCYAGLGSFYSRNGVGGALSYVGMLACKSEEIAKYVSTQFGKLVFDACFVRHFEGKEFEWLD